MLTRQEGNGHNPIVHVGIPQYVAARKRTLQESIRTARATRLAGTESGGSPYLYYGFSLHDELALQVDSGFIPMQAIQAATPDSAEFLGRATAVRSSSGNPPILLAANPSADIGNTKDCGAVSGGRLLALNHENKSK